MNIFKRTAALLLTGIVAGQLSAQELFVYTEPASNMPAKSVGIRLTNWVMEEDNTTRINYHFVPEIMWGANKSLMVHVEGYFSNGGNSFHAEGAGLYAKYRVFTRDEVYRHFRVGTFGRLSSNNAFIHQEELETNGHNTGWQLGGIGTGLMHKTALSTTVYYERALNNFGAGHEFPATLSGNAINYTLSGGRLILPKKYTGFAQTNFNIIVELLGQHLTDNNKEFLDGAVAAQFIFNSQTRFDIGYKHELYGNMLRTASNGFLIRVEHLLFNVF
jgi:hypothetical protein